MSDGNLFNVDIIKLAIKNEDDVSVLRKLYFLLDVFTIPGVPEACELHGISKVSGYKYKKIFEAKGVGGLKNKKSSGRRKKLDLNQEKILKNEIRLGNLKSNREVKSFILENFNVNLSRNWISLLFSKLTEEDSIIYPLKKKKTVQKYDSGIVKSDKATKIIWLSNNLFVLEHMSHEELAYVIKIEKDEKLLKRHMFIQFLYLTKNIKKSSLLMGISEQNGRNWIDLWNQNGEKGLIIQWGGGRPSLISKDNMEKNTKISKR